MMKVDQLLTLQDQIGDDPIMPTGRDRLDAMESLKDPETFEEVLAAMKLKKETDPEYSNKFKRQPPMPLYGGGQPDLGEQAQNVSDAGRMGDSMLMHVNPEEVKGLASIAPITVNPETGLPEAFAPPMLAALAAAAAAAAPVAVPAAIGTTAALAAPILYGGAAGTGATTAATLGSGAALYGGATGAGLGTGASWLSNLWGGYQALNPILKGGIRGILQSPLHSMATGEEYEKEDAILGAVLGMVTGGAEMGLDKLAGVPDVPTTGAKTIASKDSTTELARQVLNEELSTSDKIWAGAKKAATDPMFWGLSGLALAGAGAPEEQGRIEAVEDIQPFAVLPTPASREFVGPVTEEDIIAGVVAGEGEEDAGLGRQLQTSKEGGIVSLQYGGPLSSVMGPIAHPAALAQEAQKRIGSADDDSGGAPVVNPFVFPDVTPFQSNLSSFNVADRVKRIAGEPAPVPEIPEIPEIATGVPTDVSFGSENVGALNDLFSRFKEKQGTDEIIDLVSSALPAQEGGLLSVGGPNVFEGQVPVIGDGMEDAVKFNVVPQTPADIPNTPDMALLSSDEYVVPADVVSMLGNGSSTAGAKALDQFNSLIRKKAHGTNKQQTELNAGKELSSLR